MHVSGQLPTRFATGVSAAPQFVGASGNGSRSLACDAGAASPKPRARLPIGASLSASGEQSHGLSCRRPEAREAVCDHHHHAEGARPESAGQGRDLALRRRARFRHARQHQGGGDRRHPPRRDQVHARLRHSAAARGDRPQVQARERPRLQAEPDHRLHRRQACHLQRPARHAEPRRRGHLRLALLGQLSRDGGALRRHGDLRRDQDRERVQAPAGRARARDHAQDQVGDPELAVEPVGRRLQPRRDEEAHRRADAPPPCLGADRRHVRAPRLWRLRVRHPGPGRARPLRAHADHERRLEVLCHDRLAHRLRGRARSI